jgi:tetratricopeptide (TPR) repeat protein
MKMNSSRWFFLGIFLFAVSFPAAAQQPEPEQSNQPSKAVPAQPGLASSPTPALSPKETLTERARIQMAEKRYDAAIQTYQDMLKSEPKNALYMNMIGIAYLNMSNFDQAKKNFIRATKADKNYSSAVNNLGMVYYQQKNFRRAIREYQRAATIDPTLAGTHANLGFAYYNTNKFPEAATEFQKALELDPRIFERNDKVGTMMQDRSVTNHGLFFFTMAKVYAQKGDAAHCAEYLRKSLDEGYKDVGKAMTDPAFKDVINDPDVQAVMVRITPAGQKAAAQPPA